MNVDIVEKLKKENTLLSTMLENGTISIEAIEQSYYMGKFAELDRIHNNRIFQVEVPKTGRKQWRTYVGVGKSRRLISDTFEQGLKLKLLEYYNLTDERLLSFEDCWNKYISTHPLMVNSVNSTLRVKQLFSRYLAKEPILKRPIRDIKKAELELFCNSLIKSQSLTKESWKNVKALLNGVFEVALGLEEITRNPLLDVKINVKFAQANKKPSEDLYFNEKQLSHLRRWMLEEYKKTLNIACIAILIQAVTGMRVGELGALTWDDIFQNSIHIHRELVLDKTTNKYHIENHTKGYTNRFIPLHPKMKIYLQMIKEHDNSTNPLILSKGENCFLTTRAINCLLEKYAHANGLVVKRSHCLRRTYATLLYLAGIDKETLKEYLGHADISTTERYICAKRELDVSREIMSRAL